MTSLADLRLAIRGLRRSPLFATVAILSLALGIGANTAIFTLIDQILLRKLPVTAPDQLVMLYQRGSHNGSNMGPRMHSYPIYQDIQKRVPSITNAKNQLGWTPKVNLKKTNNLPTEDPWHRPCYRGRVTRLRGFPGGKK